MFYVEPSSRSSEAGRPMRCAYSEMRPSAVVPHPLGSERLQQQDKEASQHSQKPQPPPQLPPQLEQSPLQPPSPRPPSHLSDEGGGQNYDCSRPRRRCAQPPQQPQPQPPEESQPDSAMDSSASGPAPVQSAEPEVPLLLNARRTLCALVHYYKRNRTRTHMQQTWKNRYLKETAANQPNRLEKMRRSVRGRLLDAYSTEMVDATLMPVIQCIENHWNR